MVGGKTQAGRYVTYNVDDGLAVLLHRQRIWCLETGCLILQDDECLVRSLALSALLGYQQDLYTVRVADCDRL